MKKSNLNHLLIALTLAIPVTHEIAFAKTEIKRGPFTRTWKETVPRTVVNWLDNVSIGAINTFIGGGNVLVTLIANPVQNQPTIQFEVTSKNHGQQILVHNGSLNPRYDYSLGGFNLGGGAQQHEAGHSQQSAALGPLYLPTVGLSYLIQGHTGSFVENWADLEADLYDEHSLTFPIEVGSGVLHSDDQNIPYLVLKFSIDERVDGNHKDDTRLQKVYEWLRTKILIPITQKEFYEQRKIPLGLEVNLLRKTVRVGTVITKSESSALDFEIFTQQDYGRIEHDPILQIMHINALKWAAEFGLAYRIDDKLAISLTGGGSLAVSGYSATGKSALFDDGQGGFSLGVSARGSLNVTILKYLTVYGMIEQYWLIGHYSQLAVEGGVTNYMRTTSNDVSDILNYLDMTARYRLEDLQPFDLDKKSGSVHRFEILGGFRF